MAWVPATFWLRVEVAGRRFLNSPLATMEASVSFLNWRPETIESLSPNPDQDLLIRSLPQSLMAAVLDSELARDRLVLSPRNYQRYYTELGGSFDDYLATFSSKTRSGLRRKVNKYRKVAGADGADIFKVYRSPEEIAEFWSIARQVSALTYQEKTLDAGLPAAPAYREQAMALAQSDAVRGYCLFHQGQPISYLYCPSDQGVLEYAYLGYDPSFRKLSPGTVLQWLAFEALFSEARFTLFDFTEGEGQHKKTFATGQMECADLLLLNRTFKNRMKLLTYRSLRTVVDTAKWLLEQAGVGAKVKRWLRAR